MRGCLRTIAVVMAIIFVLTAVIAMITVPFVRVVTDRDAIKAALSQLDDVLVEAVPSIVARTLEEQARQQGLAQLELDEAVIEEAISQLLPPGWLDSQTESVVDTIYDVLETGDTEGAEINIDARPLLERLQGEPGKQVIATIIQSLPPCTQPLTPDLLNGDVKIPACVPSEIPQAQIVEQVHTQFVQTLTQNPQIMEQAGLITVPIGELMTQSSNNPELQQARDQLQRVQRIFKLAQRWSWTLWIIPLGSLFLILLLAVRSLRELGHWWGWPLLLTAVSVFIITFILPTISQAMLGITTASFPAGEIALSTQRLTRQIFNSITDVWLNRVYLQAGIMLVAGLILLLIGFIVPARRNPETTP